MPRSRCTGNAGMASAVRRICQKHLCPGGLRPKILRQDVILQLFLRMCRLERRSHVQVLVDSFMSQAGLLWLPSLFQTPTSGIFGVSGVSAWHIY